MLNSAQNDMQKQFSYLLKEKSLSHVESYLNDTNSITSQYTMLTDSIEHGDLATAFEKVNPFFFVLKLQF